MGSKKLDKWNKSSPFATNVDDGENDEDREGDGEEEEKDRGDDLGERAGADVLGKNLIIYYY